MLDGGKCHGVKKKLRSVLGHWVGKEGVHVAVLKRVVGVVLIEVTFVQRRKGISYMATCCRQMYSS